MALNHLVAPVVIRRSSRGININDPAARFERNLDEVLAFLRGEKLPSRAMLSDIMVELEISPEDIEGLLNR